MPSRVAHFGEIVAAIPVLSLLIVFVPCAAWAQTHPAARPVAPTPALVMPGASPAVQAGAPAPASPVSPPPPIVINDPLLAPVPPAGKVLTSWKEALENINARSVDLAIAVQEAEKAEGAWRQALALALPSVTATGTLTQQLLWNPPTATAAATTPSTATTTSFVNPAIQGQLQAVMPLIAPRAWYGIKTADLNIASAKLSVEDKKRTIFGSVANSIVAVFTAERVAEVNRNGLRSSLERLDLVQRQYKIGSATRLDVLRAEQDATTARSTLISGDESLRQARESLGLALGYHEGYGVPPSISLNEVQQTLTSVCAAGPLENRADIRKARNDIEVARRGINDVWFQFSPYVNLSTTATVYNSTQAMNQGNGTWNIQAVLTIPLWDGGARYGALRTAKAVHEETRLQLESTLRSADISVVQALRGISVAEKAREVSATGRDLAKEAAHLALRQFQVGTATSLDLVNAAQQERATELDLAIKDFNVINARIAAILATADCKY